MAAGLAGSIDPGRDGAQPWPTIFVGKWDAGMHLVDICNGMKPVRVLKLPMQPRGEEGPDGRFARPRNPHDDDNGWIMTRHAGRRRLFHPHRSTPLVAARNASSGRDHGAAPNAAA